MMIIVNSRNYAKLFSDSESLERFEVNTKPSLTIPDQVMSLHEILRRYVRGENVAELFSPAYDDSGDFPDLSRLDKVEREAYLQSLRKEIQEMVETINAGSASSDTSEPKSAEGSDAGGKTED